MLLWKDIQKAFLQIRIREAERNTLRFHWVKSLESDKIKVLRFPSLVFVLAQSPFILEGTLQIHFENYWHEFEETVNKIKKHIDDLVSRENTLDKVKNVTRESVELFQKQDFILQKWNSNVSASKSNNVDAESELTYVKQIFGHNESETKIKAGRFRLEQEFRWNACSHILHERKESNP